MRRKFLAVVGTVALASLFAASSALARAGDRTVDQTYPVATALCVKAHAGTLPPKLAPQATAVIAACDKLENAYPTLVSAVDAAESTFAGVLSTQKAAVASACAKPVSNHPACVTARLTARTTIANARAAQATAIATFHAGVQTNRNTFWSTIASLRSSSTTTSG
jgi:hypothetical protein